MKRQGYGTETRGGLDGRVIKVTNLNHEGPGSLKAALEEEGSRIVVFEVGGIIDFEKEILRLDNSFVTISGQTAPSPGITIINGVMIIYAHDVVMEHIRFRLGDGHVQKGSGFESEVTTA
ncbi:MAG: right-handed parallel beta-helix repeat-containing protein, partial [Spirochaetales bacterium]|nr:right-handed parallel beta-helix repeat-containing protein [Candidatus Physcosoma equi]